MFPWLQTVQGKQDSLLRRLDELDQECEELRDSVADLEDEKEKLQDAIAVAEDEKRDAQRKCKEEKVM